MQNLIEKWAKNTNRQLIKKKKKIQKWHPHLGFRPFQRPGVPAVI